MTELGFELWQTRKTEPEALVSGKFVKGDLHTAAREVETVTYHIRNRGPTSGRSSWNTLVRPNWAVVGEKRLAEGSTRCCQYTVKAAGGALVRTAGERGTGGAEEGAGRPTSSRIG